MWSLYQIVLFLLLLGIQYFHYRQFRRFSRESSRFQRFLPFVTASILLFSLPLLVGIVGRAFRWGTPHWVSLFVMPPAYIWHFISLLLFLLLMAGKILKTPFLTLGWILGRFEKTVPFINALRALRSHDRVRRFDARRRQAIRSTLTVFSGTLALGSAYEIYRKETFDATTIRIPVKNLPPSFEGFSIGFLSDIHSGVFMSGERMRSYADAVNDLKADMIVVTGDFVNSQLDEAAPLREAFNVLRAPEGVFGVLGNHDYYTRKVDDVAAEIRKAGITLLRNSQLEIARRGDVVHLAGVDDTGNPSTANRLIRSVTGKRPGTARVLLCHRPYFFKEAAAAGFGLVLSGHTHGGQVVLGELGKDVLAPARLVSPYVAGLYSEGDAKMYVSRGIGTVGVPFRFNCPPEITRVILERAKA